MSAATTALLIFKLLALVADWADKIGMVIVGKKVREILGDEFPEFYRAAEKAGQEARDTLDHSRATSDRSHPDTE